MTIFLQRAAPFCDKTPNVKLSLPLPLSSLFPCPFICLCLAFPNEIFYNIVRTTLRSSTYEWPNHCVSVYNKLRCSSPLFRTIVDNIGYARMLPRVYVNAPQKLPAERWNNGVVEISLTMLRKRFGQGSSIMIELQRILNHPLWRSAWLWLIHESHGQYVITKTIWKPRRRR